MPYSIRPANGDFEVVNDDSGEVMGKHPTRKQALDQQRALYANVADATKEAAPLATPTPNESATETFITRIIKALKEGRRNSTPDMDRLQQIHDLSVANGAQCAPFVFKEASGRLRWVMLSSNSFQDTDREIVSQKAHEQDTDRMMTTKNFGPLRWWHVGDPDKITRSPGPGIDIGDCDFSVMHGRINIESGTFRNERIGEAIKEHADTLAGSKGFFHPPTQPNGDGVFTDIYTFERSLLPRGRASNPLTALTVTKEGQDMATMKEKLDEFVALLGGDKELAQSVVNKAEQTEKEAQERGLKFKEGEQPAPETITATAPAVIVAETDKAKAEPKDEKAEPDGDEPEDKTDYGKIAEKIMPMIEEKMRGMMADSKKERTEKEAGLTAQIDALKVQLKEAQTALNTLAGDLPRGVKNAYRASQAESTVNPDKPALTTKEDRSPIGTIYDWLVAPTQGQG